MILITGGAGYIGSYVAHQLHAQNEPIIIVDNFSTGSRLALGDLLYVQGDVGDADLITTILQKYQVDTVMHFAASTIVPESIKQPLKYYANNTFATQTLVAACLAHGVKNFIFSSTAAVYGIPNNNGVLDEKVNCMPINPYGASKWMAERIIQDAAQARDLNYIILRYFNVAGAAPDVSLGPYQTESTLLMRMALQTALGRYAQLPIYGTDYPTSDGSCVRDYIHVADIADAHIAALHYLRAGNASEIFNCGYGHGYSVHQVVTAVEQVVGKPLNTQLTARRVGDPAEVVANAHKIRQYLAWQPRYDNLKLIVQHAWQWEQKLFEENKDVLYRQSLYQRQSSSD
ncbi:MAG: UDP-glucose 4-epimerase GalE [Gammaproteobacteria bacterium]